MTVVIGLLHGATFLSGLPLVLLVSFMRPSQLERTLIKSLLVIIIIANGGFLSTFESFNPFATVIVFFFH